MFSPKEVAQNYLNASETKAQLPFGRMFVLAILAGMFIAVGGLAAGVGSATLSGSAARLVSGAVFPAGLAMVLIAGSELFTGNCLMIMGVLTRRITALGMLRNLVVVWLGNLVGAMLIACIAAFGHSYGAFNGALAEAVVNTAAAKTSLSFGDAFLRGVGCNFLVCIAVWMANAAKTVGGKIAGLFFPIAAFVIAGFEHVVANMYYIPAGLFAASIHGIAAQGLTWGAFLVKNLIPVTLGNMAGGMILVGCVGWYLYLKE
ncbi:MAG: formate/nitrite transporter family protein [Oscillospiraceae bacterium]|nr:formate/nitrite transporter family protein [Oscillospiraceae bacterium]